MSSNALILLLWSGTMDQFTGWSSPSYLHSGFTSVTSGLRKLESTYDICDILWKKLKLEPEDGQEEDVQVQARADVVGMIAKRYCFSLVSTSTRQVARK